nr:isoform 2 of syntaxin-binding protein 5 [Quercus suber]
MFFQKLVEKAAKKPGGNVDGLKSSEVDPRVVFHYGIPSGSTMFAYDSIQKILAISTKDGQIKLFGKDNTQALLESNEISPSKFLQFMKNRGILLNATSKNHLEVWDIDEKLLSHVHVFKGEITSFTVMQHSLFIYIGYSDGNISVLKLDEEPFHIVQMKYTIPLSASHGNVTEVSGDNAVLHILPQPTAESKRVVIIFRDGLISLWDIRESESIFTTGGNMLQLQYHEAKKVTSACWACPFGSKVVVGYSNGEIFIWSIPSTANPNGKASRLYVIGASNSVSVNLLQVVLLNEHTESRTIKLGLHLPEACIDMEIISSSEQSKHKQDCLLLLGISGHVYAYDDCLIEKYLLQCQSRSPPSLPKELMLKMPFVEASITIAKFITDNQCTISAADEDYIVMGRNIPPLLPSETKQKDGIQLNSAHFSGFLKIKNLYITGHSDGAINFWDLSCPFLIPVFSLKQQSEDDFSLSGIALTALYFDGKSQLLVSGDQSGMVRIFKFKPEPYATGSFMSLPGSIKKGNNHIIHSVKLIKINGSVLSMNISCSSRHLAVGSEQGYVSVIDIEGPTLLYQNHIASEICTGVISVQFQTCILHGFEKNVLVVGTKDSSVLTLDSETGNMLTTSRVQPKKPSKALFMQSLDGQDSNAPDLSKRNSLDDAIPKQLVLLCSEKAVYVYSLTRIIQGVKKVHYKKKFQTSSCCWASTFYSSSDVNGLILLFTCGKIQIRSLPELSLIKETSIRGFTNSTLKPNSLSDISICTSREGELVMVNSDQEIFVISVLFQKENFRLLDTVGRIYRKDLIVSQEGPVVHKERKKGIFSSVIKDLTGSKAKPLPEVETEDATESIKELYTIFLTANFPSDTENRDNLVKDEDDIDLDIDDIDLGDLGERPKEQNMLAALNKQKLASIQAIKGLTGKFKQIKVKNPKGSTKEEQQDEKGGAVDQIKKKYGYSLSGESSAAKMAESKLHDNLRKLQGINLKATEMQDTAKSFSSMAEQVLQTEQHKRS